MLRCVCITMSVVLIDIMVFLNLGEIGGLWKNVAGRYEFIRWTKKVYAKAILKDPETYFTPEVMEKLDTIAKETYSYGAN